VTVDDQPNGRDEISTRLETVDGTVTVGGAEAGRIDTRRTTESGGIDSRSGGSLPGEGWSIAASILATAVGSGLVVLRP
jgi:hypothetical protein